MKSAVALLAAAFVVVGAQAAEPADKSLAREFLEVRGFERSYGQYLEKFSMLCSDAPESAQSDCLRVLREKIGWDAIKGEVLDLVSTTYTKDELQAAIAFLKSPAGNSYNSKNEKFASKLQALSTGKLQDVLAPPASPAAPAEPR